MKRETWIDTAKGYGILCVIIGHISTPGLTVWIYTFHIPLFFFLSGYLFHSTYAPFLFFKRKIKSLIIPYLFLIIPVVLNELFFTRNLSWGWNDLVDEVRKALIQERYSPLWFIASLFGANVLFYLIRRLHNQIVQIVIIILMSLLALLYWRLGGEALPWDIDITLFVLPFLLMGSILSRFKEWTFVIKSRKSMFLFLFFILNVLFGGLNYYLTGRKTDLYFSDVDFVLLTYLSAVCGIMFVSTLSVLKSNRFLCYLGRNSILLFAWHLIVYRWLGRLYDVMDLFQSPLPMYMIFVRDVISLICILVVLIPINELILKSRLKFMLGK